MNKVIIPREVAEAIESFLYYNNYDDSSKENKEFLKGFLVYKHHKVIHLGDGWGGIGDTKYAALNDISTYDLMRALVNGYEVEKTPEEQLRELYEEYIQDATSLDYDRNTQGEAAASTMEQTLDILGIVIKGIND